MFSKMRPSLFYVYILANEHNTVLYVGVTNDLVRRCLEHRSKKISGFTRKYNVTRLLYFEVFDQIEDAIVREKQIKGYSRVKKDSLIDTMNQERIDLFNNGVFKDPGKTK